MTKLHLTAALALALSTFSASAETTIINGCEAFKVEGANYYNLVDPTCKDSISVYSSSRGEDARAERLAAEEAEEEVESPAS